MNIGINSDASFALSEEFLSKKRKFTKTERKFIADKTDLFKI